MIYLWLCVLVYWLGLSNGQEPNATLSTVTLTPCSGTIYENVSLYKSDIYTVVSNVSLCGSSWSPNTTNGFRVHTYTEGNNLTHTPVVFVVRQEEDGVVSWTIPLKPLGFSTLFYQVNRTVCPISPQQVHRPGHLPLLYVDVFSSSPTPVDYSISVEAVEDFEIKIAPEGIDEHGYQYLVTGATAPQILYVKFPDDADVLTVQAWTEDFKCAFVSIQNNTWPVNDLLTTAKSRGIFQTMSTTAFLTVKASEVSNREFLIVIITTNFSVCHSNNYVQPIPLNNTDRFEQELFLQVKRLPPTSHFGLAIALPVIVYALLWVIGLVVSFLCCPQIRWTPPCGCGKVKQDQLLSDGSPKAGYSNMNTTALRRTNGDESDSEDEGADKTDGSGQSGKLRDESLEFSARIEADESKLKLPRMCKQRYSKMNNLYSVYSWNTVTVGIFYALPAFQLVFSEQRLLNSSGNQDQCYYNFKCAYPVGVLSAFNNVWSNVGYVMLGALFLVIVTIQKFLYNKQREKDRMYADTHGVPQYFGIYYAMGIALIIEGFMSAFYHICPTNANFQFDTAFMFIIGGLFLVKVFQNRHPDVHTNAFLAFFTFAVLMIFTLFGLYFDRENPVVVRLILFLVVLGLVLLLFVSLYHFHQWNFAKEAVIEALRNVKSYFTSYPRHKGRFLKFSIGFILNIVLTICVIVLHHYIDIASSVVLFFLMNLFYFIAIYALQKVWYREPITILAIILPLFIFAFWGTAFWFFFHHVSDWSVTPAESRELNKECILLGFYDNHDVWHFLSATAMFFSFLFLLVLDNGIADVKRQELHIF